MTNKWIPRHSQLCQDLFAYLMLEKQPNRYYVDVGCRNPYRTNNTWFLEKTLDWEGISLDIVDYSNDWKDENQHS